MNLLNMLNYQIVSFSDENMSILDLNFSKTNHGSRI